jgi:F-box and WD-40 domain protein CDC4
MASPGRSAEASSAAMQTQAVDPYAATMAHISLAPATTTTVVTTTTTTTTKFPPILFKPPHNLDERDPKYYPLAHAQAPDSIKKFIFDAGGEQACFQESDDTAGTIVEVCLTQYRLTQPRTACF